MQRNYGMLDVLADDRRGEEAAAWLPVLQGIRPTPDLSHQADQAEDLNQPMQVLVGFSTMSVIRA